MMMMELVILSMQKQRLRIGLSAESCQCLEMGWNDEKKKTRRLAPSTLNLKMDLIRHVGYHSFPHLRLC